MCSKIMIHRIKKVTADEQDILSQKARRVRCKSWIRRNSSNVKRSYRRRERMLAARELLRQIFKGRIV